MKIGIFGGSFNPPHKMHLNIGVQLINKHYVDKVIYVPTGSKYKYKNNLLPDRNRYEMLELMIRQNKNLMLSDYELKDKIVNTCETLNFFSECNKEDDIYFICGADNLSYIDKWKNGEEILMKYKIIVLKRKGEDTDVLIEKYSKYAENIIIADIEQQDISSTEIRERIKNKEYVLDFIDKEVYEYIKENRLYEE